MKKRKFLAALLALAMMFVMLPANALEVSAEEPVTYTVKWVEELDDWRYQANTNTWDENGYHRELYYLYEYMKDGDVIVVYNFSPDYVPALDLGTKKISNLTICDADKLTVIFCGDVDLFFAHGGTQVSVNCNVNTAHVYDDATANFNGNVGTLNFYADGVINSILGVSGTLGHFRGTNFEGTEVLYDFYDFKENTFQFYEHGFQTPEGNFSRTPVAVQPPVSPTPSTGNTSSGEYDDVPKTGESNLAIYLLLASVLCAGASIRLKKKA